MAQIIFNIADGSKDRIIDGVCAYYRYQDTIDGEPNPETRLQFFKRKTKENWKRLVDEAEQRAAIVAAKAALIPLNSGDID